MYVLHEASSKVPAFVGDILVGRDKQRPKSELTHAVAGGQEHSAEEGRGAVGGSVLVLTHTREPTPASDPGLRTAPPLTTPDPGETRPFGLGPGFLPEVTSKRPLQSRDVPRVAGGSSAVR